MHQEGMGTGFRSILTDLSGNSRALVPVRLSVAGEVGEGPGNLGLQDWQDRSDQVEIRRCVGKVLKAGRGTPLIILDCRAKGSPVVALRFGHCRQYSS